MRLAACRVHVSRPHLWLVVQPVAGQPVRAYIWPDDGCRVTTRAWGQPWRLVWGQRG